MQHERPQARCSLALGSGCQSCCRSGDARPCSCRPFLPKAWTGCSTAASSIASTRSSCTCCALPLPNYRTPTSWLAPTCRVSDVSHCAAADPGRRFGLAVSLLRHGDAGRRRALARPHQATVPPASLSGQPGHRLLPVQPSQGFVVSGTLAQSIEGRRRSSGGACRDIRSQSLRSAKLR